MYETPKLERYGSFRELTLGGGTDFVDFHGPNANGIGCEPRAGGSFCHTS